MVKNSIPDSTSACWNVLRCSSLEGFSQQLPLDKYTNRPYCIETIATAMFLLPPGVLQHRDPEDIDAVFGALKCLGSMAYIKEAPQEVLDKAMKKVADKTPDKDFISSIHDAIDTEMNKAIAASTVSRYSDSIPIDAHLPSLLRKQSI